MRKPTASSFLGSTPTLDGILAPGEWDDATVIHGVTDWHQVFFPVTDPLDLAATVYIKHDRHAIYFAFDITDDTLYGIDTPRWLPEKFPHANELSRRGFPWFGDGVEVLVNASNRLDDSDHAAGDGSSWQMVCNATKSRLGGIGVGGLLEGEPRSSDHAWNTYQRWIATAAQRAAVAIKPGGKGYTIEWAVRFDPCLELSPGVCYDPTRGSTTVGLNLAVQDCDHPADGQGNFAQIRHESWWAGGAGRPDHKRNWGTLKLEGMRQRKDEG